MNQEKIELMTRFETADYLQISISTLDRLELPKIKVGRSVRYAVADVAEWLKQHSFSESSTLGKLLRGAK